MSDLGDFMPDARTGQENVLAHGGDVLQTTELYDQIAAAIAELKPGLVILDNIAQMFAAGACRQGRRLGVLRQHSLGCGSAFAAAAGLRRPGRR
jgi:hypothetical protein